MVSRSIRFGTDGVRGRANTELTAEFALALGRASAQVLQPGVAVVGGDSRLSTPMIEAAFVAGLSSQGVEVIRVGVAPTPLVAYEARQRNAMGAVISASHNPYHDNGIKIFGVGGTKLADEVEAQIESAMNEAPAPAELADPGIVHGRTDPAGYVADLHAVLEGRSLTGLKIVVDAANGAATHVVREVFEGTNATVTVINDQPNGRNINDDCGATAPQSLQAAVKALGADAGIALDGDADRLIAVDANGDVVDGDQVIAICAIDLAARGLLADNTVVVTVMTNLGFRKSMAQRGIGVVDTKVGDRYVLEALAAGDFSLGGEQSGHVIFPEHSTTGDGMLTGLVLLDVVARSGRPLADLAAESMTRLPQVLVNVPVAERAPDAAERLADEIAEAEAELGDDGRVLVRASGTEPLVRVMVEASTPDTAQRVADSLAAAASSKLGR